MRVSIRGIRRMTGKAKATGNDYDMPLLVCEVPIEEVSTPNMKLTGKGFENSTIPYDPEFEKEFMAVNYPCEAEIETRSISRMGQLESIATSIKVINLSKVQAVS